MYSEEVPTAAVSETAMADSLLAQQDQAHLAAVVPLVAAVPWEAIVPSVEAAPLAEATVAPLEAAEVPSVVVATAMVVVAVTSEAEDKDKVKDEIKMS